MLVSHNGKSDDIQIEIAKLNECTKLLKNKRVTQFKKGLVHLRRVASGLRTGKEACRDFLMSSFEVSFEPTMTLLKIKDELVYKNLIDVFTSYFSIRDFRDDNTLKENYYIYDLSEFAKIFVFNLILEEPVSFVLEGYNQTVELSRSVIARTYLKSKSVSLGDGKSANIFSHLGGGIIGHNMYLLQNLKLANNEFQSELFSTRLYPISIFKDFLCRTLPVLELEDAYPYVRPNHEIELKRLSSCMQCHATMDPITNLVNKVYEIEVSGPQGEAFLVAMRAPAHVSDGKALYHQIEKTGYLRYRDNEGDYKNLNVKSIPDLGRAIGSQPDFLSCMGSKLASALGTTIEKKVNKEKMDDYYRHQKLMSLLVELI